jgi:hypothetical protein
MRFGVGTRIQMGHSPGFLWTNVVKRRESSRVVAYISTYKYRIVVRFPYCTVLSLAQYSIYELRYELTTASVTHSHSSPSTLLTPPHKNCSDQQHLLYSIPSHIHIVIMQEPSDDDDDEASISMENVREDPNLNRTFAARRKAAKRTLPWGLSVDELELVTPQQAEEIRATKRPRLEETFSASTDEAPAELPSHDTAVSLPAAAADHDDADHDDADQANENPVTGTWATGSWMPEEDAKLNSAVTNTSKKKWGTEYKTDWAAVAALVPSRTTQQCRDRWRQVLAPSIDRSNRRRGKWTSDEDSKLKDAVQTHCGKNWDAITALVTGRSKVQCSSRWHDFLDPTIDRATGRTGRWGEYEDIKLKDAVQTHGGKNWGAIAALVPGRTNGQCSYRWHDVLKSNIDQVTGRKSWTADENSKLKDAVQTHRGKNWETVATLVPGRTKVQCSSRWHQVLDPNIDKAYERTG